MVMFYESGLLGCETYADFKNVISEESHSIGFYKIEGYYGVSEYSKVFKGFDPDNCYDNYAKDGNNFLRGVCVYNLVYFTSPIFNVQNKTVTYFESEEKRNKGVRSNPTKMGKFFRKIAPYFNGKQIEFLVNYTVSHFTASVYEHKIARGNFITEIYLSRAEAGRNVGDYSCINASCMRHDDWRIHPTRVYATESWELHYLTNEEGDIGARALVCKDDDTYSYIYASCEDAGDVLKEKLEDLGFTDVEDAHNPFDGAKLLKIEGNGGLVAPYIDYHCDVKDCGDYLQITYGCADYSFSSTSGYFDCEVYCECSSCCHQISEDGIYCVDGEIYCENCVFFCDHFQEFVVGEPIFVYYINYGHYNVCEDALEDMGAVYNENDDEWQTAEWYEECTKENEEETEDEIEPKKEITPGVECVVISGYGSYHHFPIGTVVKVITEFGGKCWDCRSAELGFSQNIEEKDLVVVE